MSFLLFLLRCMRMFLLELISENMGISPDMMNKIYSSPLFIYFFALLDMSGVAPRKLFSGCHKRLVNVKKKRFSSLRLQHAALMNNCEADVRWDAISQSPFELYQTSLCISSHYQCTYSMLCKDAFRS